MNFFDNLLNRFTMYRVVLYCLIVMVTYSFILSMLGVLSFSLIELTFTLLTLTIACFLSNLAFGQLFKTPVNSESFLITAIILFFLLWPSSKLESVYLFFITGIIAMASKYLIAFKGKHIFNPAAVAAFFLMFVKSGAIWWVATPLMLPIVLIVGALIVKKIRRFTMFFTFLAVSAFTFIVLATFNGKNLIDEVKLFFLSFPVIFLGTIMLTEPLTTPPTKKLQVLYASIVGVIFSLQAPIGNFYPTPEFALMIGNVFSFVTSPKYRLKLKLLEKAEIAKDTIELVFERPKNFTFKAGQYMEWTIPIFKTDGRGNRRYFTIASSPNENVISLGVKLNNPSSSFKKYLKSMSKNSLITAGSLSGDFTLDHANKKTLVFIAGGIGVTPFKSMLKTLSEENDPREIILFYSNKTYEEIAYQRFLGEISQKINLQVVYVLTEVEKIPQNFRGEKGRIDVTMLKKYIKDFSSADFFLSGPIAMVNNYKKVLKSIGVTNKNIITDYFPGF